MKEDRLENKRQIHVFDIKLLGNKHFEEVLKDLNKIFEANNQDGLYIKYSLSFDFYDCYECAGSYSGCVYMMGHYIETDEEYEKRKEREEIKKEQAEKRKRARREKQEKEKRQKISQAKKILEKEGYKIEK